MNQSSANRPLSAHEIWLKESHYQNQPQDPSHPTQPEVPLVCQHIMGDLYLTPQEWCTASALVKGDSLTQVAKQLQLSEHTITFYLNNMLKKFNVSTQAELIHILQQADIKSR